MRFLCRKGSSLPSNTPGKRWAESRAERWDTKFTGGVIAFVDSDDYIHPNMFEIMLSAKERAHADICVCGFTVIQEDGTSDEINRFPGAGKVISSDEALHIFVYEKWLEGIGTVVWNKIYDKSVIADLAFLEGKCHEDMFFTPCALGNAERIVGVYDALYYYCLRQGSIIKTPSAEKALDKAEGYLHRIPILKSRAMYREAGYALYSAIRFICAAHKRICEESRRKELFDRERELRITLANHYREIPHKDVKLKFRLAIQSFLICPRLYYFIRNLLKNQG